MSKNLISSEILKCQNWGKITPFLGVRGQRGHRRESTPISREHCRMLRNNFTPYHFFVRALFRPLMPRTDWRTDWQRELLFLGGFFQCKDPTAYAAGNIFRVLLSQKKNRLKHWKSEMLSDSKKNPRFSWTKWSPNPKKSKSENFEKFGQFFSRFCATRPKGWRPRENLLRFFFIRLC